jgi:predicted ATP-grasp superfamily ATP-dependent carboligase
LGEKLITEPLPAVALFDSYWAPTLAFAHSLGSKGVPLHVYGSGGARWSRYCSRRYRCPPVEDADRFIPWLQQRIRSGEIARVAPTTDLIAFYTSWLRDEFAEEVRRTIAPLQELETALIKSRFSAACQAIGQVTPETHTPDNLEAAVAAGRELGYPLILKPKSHIVVGTAERGDLIGNEAVLRARFNAYSATPGQGALAERYPELRWPLLQKYLPAARRQVYSVSGIKDADGGIITAALSYKREQWPPDIGTSIAQISIHDPRVLQTGLRAVDGLISRGIFELELVAEGSQLLAIDLNPRAFGFINLDIATGHDLPWLWLQSTVKPLTSIPEPERTVALEARHVLLHFLKHLVERGVGNGPPRPERRDPSLIRDWVSIMGNMSDPVPMFLSYAIMLRHPRSLIRSQFSTAWAERGRLKSAEEPSRSK